MARLEVDAGFVGRKICKLLFNSYFPDDEEKKLERCIYMINMNKAASRKFYQLSAELLSAEDCCKFMLSILTSVKLWIKTRSPALDDTDISGKRKRKLYSNSDSDVMSDTDLTTDASTVTEANTTSASGSEDQEVEDHPYNDLEVVGGVLDIVGILWLTKSDKFCLSENDVIRNLLEKKASKCMTIFFKCFKATPVISPVIYLSSFLPERAVCHVASYCLAKAKEDDNWKTPVDSLCNWRKGDELLEIVVEGIKTALAPVNSSGKTASKGVRFENPRSKGRQLRIGLKLINYLLDNKTNRFIVLAKNRPMLTEVLRECEAVKEHVVTRLSFSSSEKEEVESEELVSILSIHFQLTVLLLPSTEVVRSMEEQLSWAEAELLPVLLVSEETPARSREQRSLARLLLQTVTSQVQFYLAAGLADPDLATKSLTWGLNLLYDGGVPLLPGLLSMLVAAAETAASHSSEAWRMQYEDNLPVTFAKILSWLSSNLQRLEEEEEETRQFSEGVRNFLSIYHRLREKDPDSWEDLMDVMVASLASLLSQKVEDEEELVKEQLGEVISSMLGTLLSLAGHDEALKVVEELMEKSEEQGERKRIVSSLEEYKVVLRFIESDGKELLLEKIESKIRNLEDIEMSE